MYFLIGHSRPLIDEFVSSYAHSEAGEGENLGCGKEARSSSLMKLTYKSSVASFCCWLSLNLESPVLEATTLPNVPQPLPKLLH